MPKRGTENVMEQDNRREISSLKDVLSQLNTSVAINTEATKALKETLEKELNRHVEDRKSLDSRVTVVETKLDNVELKMAADASARERLGEVEKITASLATRLDKNDGWSAGAKWTLAGALTLGIPCVGYVLVEILRKVFGM